MRNEVHDDNEDFSRSVIARRNRRRKQTLAGAAGLVVLGAGAFVVTAQIGDSTKNAGEDAGASVPVARNPLVPDAPTAVASPTSPTVSAIGAAPSDSPAPRTDKQRIQAARSAAANASGQVRRPLAPVNGGPAIAAADITVSVTGSTHKDGEELRLYSAHQDLTGHKELAWVTSDHEKVGDAHCTQKIRLSADVAARERPTLLICWRTSAEKSVYTVAVKMHGRPRSLDSVAAIDREWLRLG